MKMLSLGWHVRVAVMMLAGATLARAAITTTSTGIRHRPMNRSDLFRFFMIVASFHSLRG